MSVLDDGLDIALPDLCPSGFALGCPLGAPSAPMGPKAKIMSKNIGHSPRPSPASRVCVCAQSDLSGTGATRKFREKTEKTSSSIQMLAVFLQQSQATARQSTNVPQTMQPPRPQT